MADGILIPQLPKAARRWLQSQKSILLMKYLFILIFQGLLLLSCKNFKQEESRREMRRTDYSIKVELINLSHHEIYELNNYYLGAPIDLQNSKLPKPFALYHLNKVNKNTSDSSVTTITQTDCDSLLLLSDNFLKSFVFEVLDTSQTNTQTLQSCGTLAKVELTFKGQVLSGSISEIENNPNKHFSGLLEYLKKLSK